MPSMREIVCGSLPREEEPVLVIDVWEERQWPVVTLHAKDSACHEDILWQICEAARVANHGVVRIVANDHPGDLVIIQLARQATQATGSGQGDVVVDESNLVPTL